MPSRDTRQVAAARVGVVGLGALGHQVALDLARAGVGHLLLVDGDLVTADTASRQYPVTLAGQDKPAALRQLLRQYNPWQDLRLVRHPLGAVGTNPAADLDDRLDMLVDAAAEPAVTRYMAHWASEHDVQLVSVAATAGARGGTLLRLPSPAGGCFRCLEHHRADGTLPVPPELVGGWVRPPRCSQATFVGYGHDLALVAHQASRLVLAALHGEKLTEAYWIADVPADGTPATWHGVCVEVHPDCPHPHTWAAGAQLPLWPRTPAGLR